MKKYFFLLNVLLITSINFAQNENVPNKVKNTFNSKFENAQVTKWSQTNGNYEVSFELDNLKKTVLFDSKGIILKSVNQMYTTDLPKKISKYLNNKFQDYEFTGATKIIDANQKVSYIVTTTLNDKKNIFDENEEFVRSE